MLAIVEVSLLGRLRNFDEKFRTLVENFFCTAFQCADQHFDKFPDRPLLVIAQGQFFRRIFLDGHDHVCAKAHRFMGKTILCRNPCRNHGLNLLQQIFWTLLQQIFWTLLCMCTHLVSRCKLTKTSQGHP